MALARCILGKFLGVGCHCFPPPLDVPTFSARCLHVQRRERPLAAEGGTLRGREMFRQISSRIRLPRNSRDLLHAANLLHGTDGFTSRPKEGVLNIFFALKNPTASAGFEPANLGTKGQHATSRLPKPNTCISYHKRKSDLQLGTGKIYVTLYARFLQSKTKRRFVEQFSKWCWDQKGEC